MIFFAHIIDQNLGDISSCPALYFDFGETAEVDFRKLKNSIDNKIIVGGGGMLHPGVDDWIKKVSESNDVILWGVGLNYHGDNVPSDESVAEKLSKCKLVGVRDRKFAEKFGFKYVPCSSCMDSCFDTTQKASDKDGLYEHYDFPIDIFARSINNRADKTIQEAVEFLSGFEEIITNSYHGAYWSHLLGRKVTLYEPQSTRFLQIPSESLNECRALNVEFYNEVKRCL